MAENEPPKTLPQELQLLVARASVPGVLRVRARYVGGSTRSSRAWILECLNGRDWTSAISWYSMPFARDDIVREIRENTVLRIDLWRDQREAFPVDMRVNAALYKNRREIAIPAWVLGEIRHIEIRGLQLYHQITDADDKIGEYNKILRSLDNNKHLERYTINLSHASDGQISLQGIDRETLWDCAAVTFFNKHNTSLPDKIAHHRTMQMDSLTSMVDFRIANAAALGHDLPYLLGMIVAEINGELTRQREWLTTGNGDTVAVACSSHESMKVFEVVEEITRNDWEEEKEDHEA